MALSLTAIKQNFQLGLNGLSINNWFSAYTKTDGDRMSIHYQTDTTDIYAHMLNGFFEGWPNPPDPRTHLRILRGSSHIVIALDPTRHKVIGFITAVSDGVSAAFIPHLEVLPQYRGQGIGRELVQRTIAQLNDIYAIDLMCDENVVPFYEKLGMSRATGMVIRNYENQPGLPVGNNEPHW